MARSFLLHCFIALVFASSLSAAEKLFRAGAATSNITPWLGIEIEGNMHTRGATNIHDELHVRCIALHDGTNHLAIAVVDSCLIPREVFDAAKQRVQEKIGLSATNILISATHTHSAAAAVGIFQSKADPKYLEFLVSRTADAVIRAVNNLEPARIGWAVGSEPNQVFNRRWKMKPGVKNPNPFGGNDAVRMNPGNGNPDLLEPVGPTDPEVPVLAIQSRDGRPIAVLANYSLHYCGGIAPATISADYFGVFCERLTTLVGAERQDPPFVAIMSNGTSGDCNNINFREPAKSQPNYVQMTRVADDVARAAHKAYSGISYRDWVPLSSAQQELTLGVRRPSAEEVTSAKAQLEKAQRLPDGQLLHRDDIYRRETVLLGEFPETKDLILQAHRIGDLGIVAIPCEVFVELGLQLKKESPLQPTFTISLANGYNGYLPTPEHHKWGGYETWRARSSYLELGAAPKIMGTVSKLLKQVSATR